MANAHSPGGGYRKGDGAQEENLFRRSDYFRSLDIGLDQWLPERSERFQCSSSGKLERLIDPATMYSMHEFGAIYTSGLTVFRRPEKTGYAFMEKPLEGVCSLAMAAYRDPKLEGNHLAPKYATGTRKKIENVFAIAYHHKHDSLVLSALGCGAFKNPPAHVAQLFNSVIHQYAGFFKTIVFAIVDDHNTGNHLNPEGFLDSKLPPSTGGTGSLAPLKATPDYNSQDIPKLEAYLANNLKPNEMEAIKAKTMEIAEASMNLHMNPCGIGFGKDKDLGTDKTVFSILGPHLGHYYGDVFIVFKREILHHPDANFTIQAATSFISGNAFTSRPWLGADPGVHEERVKLYNASKLNASIPGYDYTAALELIAFTSMGLKKKKARASSPARVPYKEDKRTPCKWGNKCRKMGDSQHCAQYSHQANDQPAKPPCKYGAGCHNL
ncbi:unnamed protein product, partial [Rotaria sp. Silwood1]